MARPRALIQISCPDVAHILPRFFHVDCWALILAITPGATVNPSQQAAAEPAEEVCEECEGIVGQCFM